MVPTELGKRLAEVGERIIQEAEIGDALFRQWQEGFQEQINIGIGPLLEYAIGDELAMHLLDERKNVIHFKAGSASSLLPELSQGTLDLLLAPTHLELNQPELRRTPVFADRLKVFVGRESRLFGRSDRVSEADLKSEEWILSGASAGFFFNPDPLERFGAKRIVFTGCIRTVSRLLETSAIAVILPARLQVLGNPDIEDHLVDSDLPGERRDIAVWTRLESLEKPSVNPGTQSYRRFPARHQPPSTDLRHECRAGLIARDVPDQRLRAPCYRPLSQ